MSRRRKPGGDSDVNEIDSNQKNASERRPDAASQLLRPGEASYSFHTTEGRRQESAGSTSTGGARRSRKAPCEPEADQLFFVRAELRHHLHSYVPLTFYFLTFFPLFNLKFELQVTSFNFFHFNRMQFVFLFLALLLEIDCCQERTCKGSVRSTGLEACG